MISFHVGFYAHEPVGVLETFDAFLSQPADFVNLNQVPMLPSETFRSHWPSHFLFLDTSEE